jgi:hypothetical protein
VLRPAALVFLLLCIGCGSAAEKQPAASPRIVQLDWRDVAASGRERIVLRVRRLVLRRNSWSVDLAVSNETATSYHVDRIHHPGETMFGLMLLASGDERAVDRLTAGGRKVPPFLAATRFTPTKPLVIWPGQTWTGRMTGFRPLPADRYLRVIVGRFRRIERRRSGLGSGVLIVTEHAFRL